MDFLGVSIRAALKGNGNVYRGWSYRDDVPEEARAILDATFAKHIPEAVDSGFNNWRVFMAGGWFSATRATWEMSAYCEETAEALAAKIEAYYAR